jgi:1-acyl-sn-glycerol-3-phosphate acyltransferase
MTKREEDNLESGDSDEGGGARWFANLRPTRTMRSERKSSMPPASSAASVSDEMLEVPFPRHKPITIEPPNLEEENGEETLADGAPPPQSEHTSAPTLAVPPVPAVEHLQQQLGEIEPHVEEIKSAASSPAAPVSPSPASPWTPGATIPAAPFAPVATRTGPIVAVHVIPAEAPPTSPAVAPPPESEHRATARDHLPSDYYERQWGRASMRARSEDVDEFGLDPKYEARLLPLLDFLYQTYFRVEAEGTEHIPERGRCLIVANHSGGPLPYDGLMLRTTVRREHKEHRELRWLAEDFVYHLPFVGTVMNRLGAVRACQENAERLLSGGRLVAVFPEGAKGIGKLYRDRYRLQRFGRGGFIRLCLRTQTPIVPCAIVGAEEANPMLYRVEYMTKALGIPYLPITPTFPALGPLGLLPAPTKWKVTFGEPVSFESYAPDAADDDLLVGKLAERVRTTIQGMLDRKVAGRRSVWFG